MRFKKMAAITMAGIMCAGLLTGCAGTTGESGKPSGTGTEATGSGTGSVTEAAGTGEETTITFGIHVADPAAQEKVTYDIVQEFNKKYAGQYKVEFKAADTETHKTNMKLEAADGSLPQIFWMDSSIAPEFSEAGYLLDLSDFLGQSSNTASALDDSVLLAFNNGTQYGLPYQCNVEGFFYNKEVFDKAGVAYPTNGTTYEDFLKMVADLNSAGYTPIAQGSKDSNFAIWSYLAFLTRYGYSENINAILTGNMKFSNDDMLKSFQKLQELGENKAFPSNMSTISYFDAKTSFENGDCALLNTGAWDCAELDQTMGDKVGFWWGPTFSDSTYEQKISMKVPSAPLCVSAKVAEDGKVKAAVYAFLEFYYSQEAAALSYAGSVFPATNYTDVTVGDTQYALKAVMASLADGWQSPSAQPDQILSAAVQSQLYDSMLGVMMGNYTPEDALKKLDEQLVY